MHSCRYYLAKDWTPKKLEVLVDVPDHLSLEHLRGQGLQPGEQAQPEVRFTSLSSEFRANWCPVLLHDST